MLETPSPNATTETPWGLPWDALYRKLQPQKQQLATMAAAVDTLSTVLKSASVPFERLVPGGSYGHGTLSVDELSLSVYAVFSTFSAEQYLDHHLKPILVAIAHSSSPRFGSVSENGLAVCCNLDAVDIRVYAAGELRLGPKELLLPPPEGTRASRPQPYYPHEEARAVHVETSCAVLRAAFISSQPPLYKDLVRVAKKWRAGCDFMSSADVPSDYLVELLMLDAFHSAPCASPSPDLYATIFRKFLSMVSATSPAGSHVLADDTAPRSFLSWTTFYNQGAIDYCVANRLLKGGEQRGDRCALVVVDPAAPFVNVANTVGDWGELRRFARDSLSHFQNSEILETLQTKLRTLSEGMQETLESMQRKLDRLQGLEESPRRWSGNIQFREPHMNGEAWAVVEEVNLRTVTWRINARRARSDSTGYGSTVDISLQMLGKPPIKTIDVDVNFRSGTSNLVFDPQNDHVLFARRSEVVRNRDYPIQITIVA